LTATFFVSSQVFAVVLIHGPSTDAPTPPPKVVIQEST